MSAPPSSSLLISFPNWLKSADKMMVKFLFFSLIDTLVVSILFFDLN
tara:strand:+ start:127 stop:267 length:141 start_codon:yes stop_codon:yes gene_type:complete